MLRFRNPLWLLVVTVLTFAGGGLALVATMREDAGDALRIDALKVTAAADGSARLTITGRGLHTGLQALLIPDQYGTHRKTSRDTLPVPTYQMTADGRLAVASIREQRLLIIDIAKEGRPEVLGRLELPQIPPASQGHALGALAMSDNWLLAGRSNDRLMLIDLAEPVAPRLADHVEHPGVFSDMASRAGVVYVAVSDDVLQVATVEDRRLRLRPVAGSGGVLRVAVHGNRLATAGQKGAVTLYELDAQGWPRRVGSFDAGEELRDLALTPTALYLATGAGRLQEYALERWPSAVHSGALTLKGRLLRLEPVADSGLLACAAVGEGLAIVDVSRLGTPRLARTVAMSRTPISLWGGGDRLLAAGVDGLWFFPRGELLGGESAPAPMPSYPFSPAAGTPRLMKVHEKTLIYDAQSFVVAAVDAAEAAESDRRGSRSGIVAVPAHNEVRLHRLRGADLDDGALDRIPFVDPRLLKEKVLPKVLRGTGPHADLLAVGGWSLLKLYRLDADGAVREMAEMQFADGQLQAMAWLEPGFIVLALLNHGLYVYDVRNPAEPVLVAETPLPDHLRKVGAIHDVLIDGRRLFVSRARLGVEVYDLSDPARLRLQQRIDTPGSSGRLTLGDGLLFVADQDAGIFVIDVRGRISLPVGSYPLPSIPHELLSADDHLYATTAGGGVLILPKPVSLGAGVRSSGTSLELQIPAAVPAGDYLLTLYDEHDSAGAVLKFPVPPPEGG